MESNRLTKAQQCGIRCRSIRMVKGMSQQELAQKINCTAAAISKYEKEGISNIDTIEAISNALGQDITADQFDQEGDVGEVGKEILYLLVEFNGSTDFENIVCNLYGMKSDRISNELFKLERIGAVVREQYNDFCNEERDVVFITAKGVIIYKNCTPFGKTIDKNVTTYDAILSEGYNSYQDVIDSDKVTALLTTLDNSGLSFRCDYLTYLCDYHFNPRETQNKMKTFLYSYPETREDALCGETCYVDILRRMMQKANRKELDSMLLAGLEYWEGDTTEIISKDYTYEATGLEQIQIDAMEKIYKNLIGSPGHNLGVDLLNGLDFDDKVEEYKHRIGIDKLEKEAKEDLDARLSDYPERELVFLKALSDEQKKDCTNWFKEEEIRDFIEKNFLPPATDTERHIDEIIHKIWDADESTLEYYYSFPQSWEKNGLAQLVRDKVGVPTRGGEITLQ